MSTGKVFCGISGPMVRKDCIVMGSEVNMAARLMGKAKPGMILCSKKIYKVTKVKVEYDEGEKIKIKGFEGGFPTYSPVKVVNKVRKSLLDLKAEHSSMLGRQEELAECVEWAAARVKARQSGMVIIKAPAGFGKR